MSFFLPLHSQKYDLYSVRWHRILFVFFLLSLPFSIRKVVEIFSPDGSFNEYLDISLYLSDILLILTIWLYILENKNKILSRLYWRKMFHVEHLILPVFVPLLFIVWSGLSIFWSENISLAEDSLFRLIEGYFLYLYILINNVPRGTSEYESEKCSTWNILKITSKAVIVSGLFQSIIAITQFLSQKSLGMTFLKESILGINDPGVAKVVINGYSLVRSYGFFPHPNILGGFLATSLLITIAYPLIFKIKMFHVEQSDSTENVPRGTIYEYVRYLLVKCSTWNNCGEYSSKMFHVEHRLYLWLYKSIIFIQLMALLLSFSKSAVAAFIIGLVLFIFGIRKMFHVEQSDRTETVPRRTFDDSRTSVKNCSTWNNYIRRALYKLKKMFHVEHLAIITGTILTIIFISVINLSYFIVQPLAERSFFMESVSKIFRQYYFEGLGIGQYVFDMQNFYSEKLLLWELQPIHNVFLLVLSEVGLVGLCLFLWFLVFVFMKNRCWFARRQMFQRDHSKDAIHGEENVEESKEGVTAYLFRSLFVMVVFIMLFDHYFWDIQQGQLLFWLLLAFTVPRNRQEERDTRVL